MLELAYRLAVSEQPMIRRIRERVVVLINPVSNPDGRAKMADWFYRYLKGKTDYDSLPRQSPPYWGRYVFVDANRDAHQQTQELTRAVYRMFWDYHPTVIHDLHEAIPLLQTWNGTGPYNPNLDPIVTSEFLEMSFHEVTRMTALGMPGVWTWDFGEGFGHHYLDSIAMNHNAIGRGYETFGNATGETVERALDPGEITRRWFRPWPPPSPLRWSMRDSVNYTQTGLLAILDYTAVNAERDAAQLLPQGLQLLAEGRGREPLRLRDPRGPAGPPAGRPDGRTCCCARASRSADRAEAFAVQEGSFPAGSFVVRLDQPYRNYAVDLLLPQEFPADAEHQPYDDISWALPVHYGVATVRVDDRAIVDVPLEAGDRRRPRDGPHRRPRAGLPAAGHRAGSAARGPLPAAGVLGADRRDGPSGADRETTRPARGSCRLNRASRTHSTAWRRTWHSISTARPAFPRCPTTTRPPRGSACGCRGPTPTPSAGCATPSISAGSPTPISGTRTSARATSASAWT